MSRSLRASTLAVLIGGWAMSTPAAWAHLANKVVRYRGYGIRVPASWPVYDLTSHPTVCVRFDRHAVYLGTPSADQRCPAHAVGRTEAILVEPVAARGARSAGGAGAPLPGVTVTGAQARQGSSAELGIPGRGVLVTATWAKHRNEIERALGVRSIGGAGSGAAAAAGPSAAGAQARAQQALDVNPAARTAALGKGLGFDACSAPSAAQMSAWKSSPYHAVGIYLGGTNMACAQSNLSTSWVRGEVAAGWHLIPAYVGLQAPTTSCSCAKIKSSSASAEGTAAASDAVSRAAAVGIGKRNPIYFDMEAYDAGGTSAVLAFLSAWTKALHADGYTSGVYSSAGSGIRDLVAAVGSSFIEPDDIWIANWNGTQSTSDPYVPSSDWANHQRLHQYQGGHNATYGGVTLNIDSNYLDGATAGSGSASLFPDGTFVWIPGTLATYRIAGGAPLFVSNWAAVGGPQPFTTITQQQFSALNPVPANGTFLQTSALKTFRVAGGAPFAVTNWSIYGGPQPFVAVDEWDIDNISNPAAHLSAKPANGTIVEGLPSHTYWSFTGGARAPTSANRAAVTVDDIGLAAFPRLPPASGGTAFGKSVPCVVPSLRRMTLGQATRALKHAHCHLGRIHRPRHVRRHHVLRVTKQSARAKSAHAASYAVNVTLG